MSTLNDIEGTEVLLDRLRGPQEITRLLILDYLLHRRYPTRLHLQMQLGRGVT